MNDDKRDKELDEILDPLTKQMANDRLIQKWQAAVRNEQRTNKSWLSFSYAHVAQIAAAAALGFFVGAWSQRPAVDSSTFAENSEPSATIEYTFAKAE